ncbi:unnamed protein product [Lupinus luteus]|uniref:Uncharacterized protein n=1 Tax=Lupinus luteus TaxID=3873 RepID=A0AAV1VX12_LUPLU
MHWLFKQQFPKALFYERRMSFSIMLGKQGFSPSRLEDRTTLMPSKTLASSCKNFWTNFDEYHNNTIPQHKSSTMILDHNNVTTSNYIMNENCSECRLVPVDDTQNDKSIYFNNMTYMWRLLVETYEFSSPFFWLGNKENHPTSA